MTDQNNQEPTMEEILASIRRIISEDDPPAGADAAAPVDEAPSAPADTFDAAAAPAPVQAVEDDEVLELTDRVEPESAPEPQPVESLGDLDVFPAAAPPPPEPRPQPAPAPIPAPAAASVSEPEDSLISTPAASASASAFAALTQSISMPRDGRTLEDVTRELLRPLIKQWLDEHLPRIVENAVQTEVERIARRHS